MGVKYVVRYMDDIAIFHHSKEFLHWLKNRMDEYLQGNLKLKIKDNWQVFPTNSRGVDFVGYRHFFGFKLLRKKTYKRFRKRMLSIARKIRKGTPISYKDWCSFNSYKGWLDWCDSFRLKMKYVVPIQTAMDEYYLSKIKRKAVMQT